MRLLPQQQQSLEQRIRELAQVIEQRRERAGPRFVGRKDAGRSGDRRNRAGRIERLQHEREQVNAQTAELVARKQAQEDGGGRRAKKRCASSAGA